MNENIKEIDQKQLKEMLDIYSHKGIFKKEHIGLFICKEDEKYLGIDNISKELFIEEFDTKEKCINYLNYKDE